MELVYPFPLHTYVCPIHMYVAIAKVLGGKVSEPRRDDGNRRRITNVDRLSSGRPNARPLFNSPPTCGRTERISRRDGRRLSRLEIQSVLSATLPDRQGECKGKTADGNITRLFSREDVRSRDFSGSLAGRNAIPLCCSE